MIKEIVYNECLDFENYQISDQKDDHNLITPIQHYTVLLNLLLADKELRNRKDDWESAKEWFTKMGMDVEEIGLQKESFEWVAKNFIINEDGEEDLKFEIGSDGLNMFNLHISRIVDRVQNRFGTVQERIDKLTDLLSKTERILMENKIDTEKLKQNTKDIVAPDYLEKFADDTTGMTEFSTRVLDEFFSNIKVDIKDFEESNTNLPNDIKAACEYGVGIETDTNGVVKSQYLYVDKRNELPTGGWDSQARKVLAKVRHSLSELNSSVLSVYSAKTHPDFVEGIQEINDFSVRASSTDALIVLSRGIENTILHRGRELTLCIRSLLNSLKE